MTRDVYRETINKLRRDANTVRAIGTPECIAWADEADRVADATDSKCAAIFELLAIIRNEERADG